MFLPIILFSLLLSSIHSETAIPLPTSSRTYTYNSTTILDKNSIFIFDNDDIYVTIDLPFPVTFQNYLYSRIFVSSNSLVSFDAGFSDYTRFQFLPTNKILIKAQDYTLQRLRVFKTDENLTVQF